jgi:hypothetical protein
MNFHSDIIRDRRTAASDETVSVRHQSIYGLGSRGRAAGATGATDRLPAQITTIILHQTAGNPIDSSALVAPDNIVSSNLTIDRIAAHFIVTTDGRAIYLRDVEYILSNAGGRRGIDIEFCGRFEHRRSPHGPRLTRAAIECGRALVRLLVEAIPTIRYIHPHGQVQHLSADSDRPHGVKWDSCSGPDIWVNVGEWAASSLGLSTTPAPRTYQDHGISPRQSNQAWRQDV